MEHISKITSKTTDTNLRSSNNMRQIYTRTDKNDEILNNGILSIAKEIVPNFVLTDDLKELYSDLFAYFTGNEGKYDLSKGIYLYGIYGVGKTITMKIFSKFLQTYFNFSPNNYGTTSVEEIAEYYKQNGNLLKFGRNWEEGKMLAYNKCINEFGKPLDEKHYGTSIQNVVNSMIMIRYELLQERKAITHATSNYHPNTLTCFDNALLDRFKEMFNFIELQGKSFRS